MEYNLKNPIIAAAVTSCLDTLLEDTLQENAEHVKYIDRLECKYQSHVKQIAQLKQQVEEFDVLWFNEIEEKAERVEHIDHLETKNEELVEELNQRESNDDLIKRLASCLRSERSKNKTYAERLSEFTIIVDETHDYAEKQQHRHQAYIAYLNEIIQSEPLEAQWKLKTIEEVADDAALQAARMCEPDYVFDE